MSDSLLREILGDEFELFMLGTVFGRPDERLMGMIYRLLSTLGEIFRRVDDVEDANRKGNWDCIKDVIWPFVTCDEGWSVSKSEKWMEKFTIEIARGWSCVKVNRNELCSGFYSVYRSRQNCTYQQAGR